MGARSKRDVECVPVAREPLVELPRDGPVGAAAVDVGLVVAGEADLAQARGRRRRRSGPRTGCPGARPEARCRQPRRRRYPTLPRRRVEDSSEESSTRIPDELAAGPRRAPRTRLRSGRAPRPRRVLRRARRPTRRCELARTRRCRGRARSSTAPSFVVHGNPEIRPSGTPYDPSEHTAMLTQSSLGVPSAQSCTWSIAAFAADAADDAPRASITAAPRCCTVGMNVPLDPAPFDQFGAPACRRPSRGTRRGTASPSGCPRSSCS